MSGLLLPKPERRGPKQRKRIRTRRPAGTKRREAKAAGYVDPDTWIAICFFYRDPEGMGRIMCAYCETQPATQQDHVVALAHGGKHAPDNVVPCCEACQYKKGTQTWEPKRRHPFMERGAR